MSRRRIIGATALASVLLATVASVAAAHPGHGLRGFDVIWVDWKGVDAFTAAPGDRNLIIGLGGADVLDAGDRHDHVLGGRGSDSIIGGDGPDKVVAGPGDDTVWADGQPVVTGARARADVAPWRNWVSGGRGDDTLVGGDGRDRIFGGPGVDAIDGAAGPDILAGGPRGDTITGGIGHDVISAGPGADTVYAADGEADWVRCGPGVDSYTADAQDRVGRDCETALP